MNAEALEDLGFRSLYDGRLWVRVEARDGVARGTCVVFGKGGGRFVGRASYPIAKAKKLVSMLCAKIVKCERGTTAEVGAAVDEKHKAEKLLAALLASDLSAASLQRDIQVVGREVLEYEDETGEEVGATKAQKRRRSRRRRRRERRAEAQDRRQARRKRFKKGLKNLAGKVAKNKVLVKMREGWAKILEGPIGDAAGKVLGGVLAIYGVPPKVTEAAFNVHTKAAASRARAGGWAGVIERTAADGARATLRESRQRWGKAAREGLKESGKQALAQMQGKFSVGYGQSAIVGAQESYAVAVRNGVAGHLPAGGIGYGSVYQIGACV